MTRKKKASSTDTDSPVTTHLDSPSASSLASNPSYPSTESPPPNAKPNPAEPSTSSLVICRNKHWRYISSFHGPWLQLPPEILESLAFSNYRSPHPRPIDPDVFFDLVKVRRLIEDATDLSIRAANGTTSASLANSMNASNGMFGGSAAALGLGSGGSGAHAKLSRERKHRMRENATQKLARAYQLDEIAASVAMMQGASSLEEVAKIVLQRSINDTDAKYVHFFHEKIPSRMMAECTDLTALDEIIRDRPSQGPPLRTRAVTKLFKDDYEGALQDLTEALRACRHASPSHAGAKDWLVNCDSDAKLAKGWGGHGRQSEPKLDETKCSNSLEVQLLFHRAGVYLTLACLHIRAALDKPEDQKGWDSSATAPPTPNTEMERRRLEAQKAVKLNAKRALRDYTAFLSHFGYTPGLTLDASEQLVKKMNSLATGTGEPQLPPASATDESPNLPSPSTRQRENSSNDMILRQNGGSPLDPRRSSHSALSPTMPPLKIYSASDLFSPSPPADLPPYPPTGNALVTKKAALEQRQQDTLARQIQSHVDRYEAVTYHPLLTDALHSLLLCHSLVQTPPKELLRHANMVARLARVCDGYPIFLAARSPSRSDWIQILQRADNWIAMSETWEHLCAPAPLYGHNGSGEGKETAEQARERRRHEVIVEALADERVHDATTFQAAVEARASVVEKLSNGEQQENGHGPKRWAQEDGKDFPIGTERAESIARWIQEAPYVTVATASGKRGAKSKSKKSSYHADGKKGEIHGESTVEFTAMPNVSQNGIR